MIDTMKRKHILLASKAKHSSTSQVKIRDYIKAKSCHQKIALRWITLYKLISSELQLDVCCRSCCGGDIWWMHTKERQAWCCLQVKLCDPRLSASSVVATIKALYKYTSFLSFPLWQETSSVRLAYMTCRDDSVPEERRKTLVTWELLWGLLHGIYTTRSSRRLVWLQLSIDKNCAQHCMN